MPHNLTRREFLKDVGLLGAAIGAGSSLAPMEAFGENWSDKAGLVERPFWVKETDWPTMEIDWKVMQRYNEQNTCRSGFAKYVSKDELKRLGDLQTANMAKFVKAGKPGYTLRDMALYDSINKRIGGPGAVKTSFLGPKDVPTPQERGVPRWEGKPEENSEMIRAALRAFGAATVGFVELDPNTTENLLYSVDPDGKDLLIMDVDQPSETDKARIIPRKARWVIVWTVQMSQESLARVPTPLGAMTTNIAYEINQAIISRLQGFLRGIGYMGLGEASINALGIAPAFATMAGLGEMSRINRLITPEYGPMVRVFKMVTDLPLAPTKPINAGIMEFCKYCKTCAQYCPSNALSLDTDPTWEPRGAWSNKGHRAYFENSVACRSYWYEIGTNCGICFSVCPFAQKDKAAVHKLVQATIGVTPALDNFFAQMSRTSYLSKPSGEPQKDPAAWWKLDLPELGIDSTRGHKDV